jgi:hypothetical protein
MLLLILVLAVPAFGAQDGPGLSKHAQDLLAQAQNQNQTTTTLLLVAKPGRAIALATTVAGKGATIRYQDNQLGYIRVIAPLAQAEAIAKLPDVQAVEVNEIVPLPSPEPQGTVGVITQPVPSAATPKTNPYMPIQDIGGDDFMAAHPTWDGRDVRIGIVDSGVTLDHPSLQTTSTGKTKIIDWVTFTDPLLDGDPTWVPMSAEYVQGPSFTWNTVTYTAPAAKKYRIGIFNERVAALGGEVGSDVNRDGNPGGSSGLFPVLWDVSKGDVWVDTNQNNNFADDMKMKRYDVNYDVNYFGTDNPATPVAERMPFVVQPDKATNTVNIGIVSGAHGSHVAGIAAGNSLFGGDMSGMAPGAHIVSVRACLFVAGCTNAALIEGMIYAVKSKGVDVVNMSIGGLPSLNDGNNARAILYSRLIDQYDVQIFISAGNSGPGMNTIGDPSVATKVMSVGAYISDDTYLADYGAQLYEQDNLHYFSSRGPREDGGFKPNIVASGAAISTIPMWQAQGCLSQVCPVGYALFNGTSMASPQAAGGAALLISAAQQAKVQHLPEQIRQAMNSTARYLTGRYQVYEQGNGLVDIPAAWALLSGAKMNTVTIESSVPVNTVLSGFLAVPGYGVGINDREGVKAGDNYVRTYTFRRTDGAAGNKVYNVSWVDNDGTFSSAGTISLPKNANVSFPVTINPTTSGVHSAILNLNDPTNPGIEYQTMNVVVAADQFTAGNNYTVAKSGNLGPGQFVTYFFNVPAGTPAFKVDMTGGGAAVGAGAIRFLRWHPYGATIDNNGVSNCYNPSIGGCSTGGALSRTVTNPFPGVWEVTVDARRNSDAVSAPFTLTASILGATVAPNPDTIASATVGVPVARNYTITNIYGAFTGRAVGGALGSAKIDTPTIAHGAVQTFDVMVPAGTTALRATIGSPSDPGADLDLFVYNCVSGTCVLAASTADGDSEESATVANPAAGLWRVEIDGYSVPAGTTTYKYIDLLSAAAYGTIAVTDADALRAAGAVWVVPGTVTANAVPATGRVLYGTVQVRTSANVLIGQGEVIVQSVTP